MADYFLDVCHRYDMDALTRFTLTVRKNYRSVPYHNWAHAFSVAHAMFTVIKTTKNVFTPLEVPFYLNSVYFVIKLNVTIMCFTFSHKPLDKIIVFVSLNCKWYFRLHICTLFKKKKTHCQKNYLSFIIWWVF